MGVGKMGVGKMGLTLKQNRHHTASTPQQYERTEDSSHP